VEIAAAKEKFDILPILYIHFSRLQYMVGKRFPVVDFVILNCPSAQLLFVVHHLQLEKLHFAFFSLLLIKGHFRFSLGLYL